MIQRCLLGFLLMLVVGCDQTNPRVENRTSLTVVEESTTDAYSMAVFVGNLEGPTQMVAHNGRLIVAQLNGGENDKSGQILAIDPDTGAREVWRGNLNKPTGVAVLAGYLWVMERDTLSRSPLDDLEAVEVVWSGMPNNGRSNGTLTVTPQGTLLFETSGRRRGETVQTDSGILWELDPAQPDLPQPLAVGLKGAYAHTVDADGNIWTTEIGDDRVNGDPPPDEINLVKVGADYGWPACYGDQEPAFNYGGSVEICVGTERPFALFAPQATPTSIVQWQGELLVALWVESQVVRLTPDPEPFLTGFARPQHLLVWQDGSLLISDHQRGIIYRVWQPA